MVLNDDFYIAPKSKTYLLWNSRGKAVEVQDRKEAERIVREAGFRWCFDPNIKPGTYNPAYDQGTSGEYNTSVPMSIKVDGVIQGDVLNVIKT